VTVLMLVARVVVTVLTSVDVPDTGVACRLQAEERIAEGHLVSTAGVDKEPAERFAGCTVVVG
jgi:hypothetical protein